MPSASAISWTACWKTVVANSLSQCRLQPEEWGRIPETHRRRRQHQQEVDQSQAQHHLQQQVETEEPVDQIDQGEQQGEAPTEPPLNGGEQGLDRRAEQIGRSDLKRGRE